MFPPVYVADIAQHEGQEVTLHGWLHNRRSSGKLHFLQVRDGTGHHPVRGLQGQRHPGGLHRGRPPAAGDLAHGHRRCEEGRPLAHRLRARRARTSSVVARPAREFPIGHKEHGVAFLMEQRHLWLRSQRQNGHPARPPHRGEGHPRLLRRAAASPWWTRPIFTPAACEGTSTLFEVPYFDLGKAYLTQSGQLYMEAAAMALGQGLLLRPHLPRREVEDAPPPDRVLDGGAGGGLHGPRRRHGAHGAVRLLRGAGRRWRSTEKELAAVLERRRRRSCESVKAPFPRITYTEAVEVIRKEQQAQRAARPPEEAAKRRP